jgi:hypothetical protein
MVLTVGGVAQEAPGPSAGAGGVIGAIADTETSPKGTDRCELAGLCRTRQLVYEPEALVIRQVHGYGWLLRRRRQSPR